MTLEAVRALPWHEHDSIMEQLLADTDEGGSPGDGSLASLGELGFNVRQVP
jgi:hypothetical protein